VEGAGVGPFCFAYCRDDSAHLLPQEMSAGAKPNDAFSMCQHFCKNIFTRPAAGFARQRACIYGEPPKAGETSSITFHRRVEKHRVYCCFLTHTLLHASSHARKGYGCDALQQHLLSNKRKLSEGRTTPLI
ncbi:MAG: hypothetical protein ABI858_11685, partial [Pseudoxanthomonas sp.]